MVHDLIITAGLPGANENVMICRFATQISGLHKVKLQSRHRRVAEMTY